MSQVFVVPHTHWDREWYETAPRFRQRLVEAVDELIEILESNSGFRCFLLDGQTAILQDYLTVRPDQRERLAALVGRGRILIGPWYVLADELLCPDEVLVRNLFEGRRLGSALGGWLRLGYSPDAFGHPAALPTILQGFGIECAIVWRGYGGERGQGLDLFRWVAPDGTGVLAHHLPPGGYEIGAGLTDAADSLAARWRQIEHTLVPRAVNPALLLMSGADHHAPAAELPDVVRDLEAIAPAHSFRLASPMDYFAALPENGGVPEVRGELRFSYRYAWTLQGVHSTRSNMKAAVAEASQLLLRWAEPQLALVSMSGRDHRPLLQTAWREQLLNYAHDTIAGCSADEVAAECLARTASAATQARGLLVDALYARLGLDRRRARRQPAAWRPTLAVVNPSPWARSGVLEATVTTFERHVPVGPPDSRSPGETGPSSSGDPPRLVDSARNAISLQVLGSYPAYERLDSPDAYPDQDLVRAHRVALWVDDVPAMGERSLTVLAGLLNQEPKRSYSAVRASAWGAESERGSLRGHDGGGFTFVAADPSVGAKATFTLGRIQSERDEGDTYTFQPCVGDDPIEATWAPVREVWDGPLIAAISRDFEVDGRARGTVYARLDAGSELARVVVTGCNLAGNHRLRMTFAPARGSPASSVIADMQYGPTRRTRVEYRNADYPKEWPVRAAPMHRFVSTPEMSVFARGRHEYELLPNGALTVTLHRSVGELSRSDLQARPGHAAFPALTPGAQEIGSFRVELAFAAKGVRADSSVAEWDAIERLAEEFHAPLAGLMIRHAIDPPATVEGPELKGLGLAFKSLKPRETGAGMTLRFANVTQERTSAVLTFPAPIRRAFRARLDETPLEPAELSGDRRQMVVECGPREVVTLVVEP